MAAERIANRRKERGNGYESCGKKIAASGVFINPSFFFFRRFR